MDGMDGMDGMDSVNAGGGRWLIAARSIALFIKHLGVLRSKNPAPEIVV